MVGYSPQGHKELNTTEQPSTHTHTQALKYHPHELNKQTLCVRESLA